MGVVGTGLAYLLWFRGIAQLKASAVSYLGLIGPVMATMIGFVWLQETLTLMQLIGIAIIFTSVLLGQKVNVSGQQRKTPLYSNGDISNPQRLGNPSRSR